jgi:hypothetical protein
MTIGKMPKAQDPIQVKCIKCGDLFNRIVKDQITGKDLSVGRKVGDVWLCGYCEEVIYGKPDTRWLGDPNPDDCIPKGYHSL